MHEVSIPASINDHDALNGHSSRTNWPDNLHPVTLKVHFHLCELLHAWNAYPFKRVESFGIAAVDEWSERMGQTRFSFTSEESLTDFLDLYGLDDFELKRSGPNNGTDFWWLTLTNKFAREDVNEFLKVYAACMNNLAVINDERLRAIRTDGGKVGFICVDHFSAREAAELIRIKQARMILGEGFKNNES